MRRAFACLVGMTVLACSSQPMPIRLQGDPVSIAWLAGSWNGEYWGAASGRHGTLNFYLPSGTDSLFGDVTMMDPMGNVVRAADPMEVHRLHVRTAQQLQVEFVAVRGDTVRGMLEPYIAEDCNCTVTTTFLGQMRGDVITGTFETHGAGGVRSSGMWRVTRVGTTPP